MIYKVADPVADYNAYDADCQAAIERMPRCVRCENPINVDDVYYRFNGELFCKYCFDMRYVPEGEEDEVEIL